eukprot:TRINITY_DN9904_c0_g1_i2.p2 TRINITY_DN9904_c0_g1~~TRINITY_DN9904_c0_g1_i2.p2  ORF type:complete len:158 (-),score=43.13 TRINITY_DN9904_c0_g1_i2:19-492(-)
MRPMTTKGKPESKAWTKAETGFLTTRRNPYHEMLIMAEKIHSERKLQDRPIKSRYSFNPHNIYFITEKPNAVTPVISSEDIEGAADEVRETLKSTHGVPKEKYRYPATSSQEIGWFEFEKRPQTARRLWHHPLNLSLIHICRCRRLLTCRSRWSPYH